MNERTFALQVTKYIDLTVDMPADFQPKSVGDVLNFEIVSEDTDSEEFSLLTGEYDKEGRFTNMDTFEKGNFCKLPNGKTGEIVKVYSDDDVVVLWNDTNDPFSVMAGVFPTDVLNK